MKKLILLALTAWTMVGCEYKADVEIEEAKRLNGFNIIIVDSCEYLKCKEGSGNLCYGFFAHKGNCRFCKERRQKELKELVTILKK